ncbi:30S ribosomal protein S12 methylthiotransferase RimO [Marinilabiliaceae bacterium ANBcel2]|nr:30S ribosomal protein S12 methylthiotransferase RimO [Marinilabiliaceae bacterium ANBcel2]
MKTKRKNVDVITLGCSKNLVDSEFLIKQFNAGGFSVKHDPETPSGNIAIINTCGFIGDAKEESVNLILEFAEARKRGDIEKLYVMGCLSQRYFEQLGAEIPEVDKFYGKFDWHNLTEELGMQYRVDLANERTLTTPGHYAYLKIAEGCNRTCSYCAIPIITGKYKSHSINSLVDQAHILASQGVKELQLIAQDLTYYGIDLYKKPLLAQLTDELSKIDGIEWIRLHYAYPAGFPKDLPQLMAQNPKVCRYLDLALQHISDPMLNRMRRNFSKKQTYKLIDDLRSTVPGLHLRTTLITGHPGESEQDFKELLNFVEQVKFERLGVFTYSHEEDTYAYNNYKDDIPQELKQERANIIMESQNRISRELNEKKSGKLLKVIMDRKEGDFFIGRTEFDSPEVDPEVVVETDKKLEIGSFYNVTVTGAEDYDLKAHI